MTRLAHARQKLTWKLLATVVALLGTALLPGPLAAGESEDGGDADAIRIRVKPLGVYVDQQEVLLPDVPPDASLPGLPKVLERRTTSSKADDATEPALLHIDPAVRYERFYLVFDIAREHLNRRLRVQIGEGSPMPTASPIKATPGKAYAGLCFENAKNRRQRELCWKNLRGGHQLNLTMLVTSTGIDLRYGPRGADSPQIDGCPKRGPDICLEDPESVVEALNKSLPPPQITRLYPWRTLYAVLIVLDQQVDSDTSVIDSNQVAIGMHGDLPMGVLRGFVRANCRYDQSEYADAERFWKDSDITCTTPLFEKVHFGLPRKR